MSFMLSLIIGIYLTSMLMFAVISDAKVNRAKVIIIGSISSNLLKFFSILISFF
jgi:hypothetical protein